jgi:two-component system copper resistance phosphate regulon response regulator CusR
MRLLVVEDHRRIAALLKQGLAEEGFAVDVAYDGEEGLEYALAEPYDAIVLDIGLPRLDGLAVCRALRQRGDRVPILMLTARDAIADRIAGLNGGADDYLTKPFAFGEFLARIRALLRRANDRPTTELRVGDLVLDPVRHEVRRGRDQIQLPAKEFAILEYLLQQPGRVATRAMIEEHVWGSEFAGESNVIDVHIRSLRRRLGDQRDQPLIETVRGVGYRIAGETAP